MRAKEAYLNPRFFLTRAILYFAVWMALATLVRHRPRLVSAVGLIALGLSTSFAAFDWLMSLSPAWSSTVYGLYYFVGGMLANAAFSTLVWQ